MGLLNDLAKMFNPEEESRVEVGELHLNVLPRDLLWNRVACEYARMVDIDGVSKEEALKYVEAEIKDYHKLPRN